MSQTEASPTDTEIEKGRNHIMQGELGTAEEIFRNVLDHDPESMNALYNLGLVCVGQSKREEGLALLEKVEKAYKDDPKYWTNIGNVYYPLEQTDKAVEAWEKAIALDPKSLETRINLSHVLASMERYEEAEKHAREALKAHPENAGLWQNLANALVRQNGRLDEAVECWNKSLSLEPENVHIYQNMGHALQDSGRLAEAEKCFREILDRHPDSVATLNNLGNVLREQRKMDEAEDLYLKAIDIEPENVQLYNNYCLCLAIDNRYKEATLVARQALEHAPDDQRACVNLSSCLRNEGRIEEAEKWARKAVKIAPDEAQTLFELAEVMVMKDRYVEADALLKKIEKLPDLPSRSYVMLAKGYMTLGMIEYAMEIIDKAVEINPELPDSYYLQSTIYHMMNRIDESIEALQKGIDLQPGYVMPRLNICDLYLARGDKESAKKCIEEIKAINPDIPEMYHFVKYLKKFTEDDPDFKKLLEFENKADELETTQKVFLFYTLFRAYEDVGNYDKAFENLKKANDLQGRQHDFTLQREEDLFNSAKKVFTKAFVEKQEGKGHPSELPVFVLGMPRSGTTLTEQILASHPDVFGAGEANIWSLIDQRYGNYTQMNPHKRGEYFIEFICERCPDDPKRIVDKTPINYRRIGEILCTFPNAKIIHCQRDPVDVGFSCYKQHFTIGQYWSYALEDIVAMYKLYEDIMEHWRDVFPGRFLEIKYEDTVNVFEQQARKLIDYIGLEWDDACLKPHKAKRSVITASKMQVTKPIYKSSVKAWKRYEKQLQPLIKGLKGKG